MSKPAMKPDQVVSALNNLIETCRDGQNGFADAAEHIQNPQIKTFCLEQSRTRAQFVGELQQEALALGGDPENTGSTAAAIHRAWIDLKSALGGGDHAILGAAETGEDSAVKAYDNALKEQLPAPVRAIVERQRQNVKQSHDLVKTMRDQSK
jgi:uncharacterized protein (TIGR02284 family)